MIVVIRIPRKPSLAVDIAFGVFLLLIALISFGLCWLKL